MLTKLKQFNWKNWWDYHWGWVLCGVLAVLVFGWYLRDAAANNVEVDYYVAYVAPASLDNNAAETLTTQLETLCDDRSGDGKVVVELHQYPLTFGEEAESANAQQLVAAYTMLAGEASTTEYAFWIVADPEGFHAATDLLIPAEDGSFGPLWADCPVLARLDLTCLADFDSKTVIDWQELLGPCTVGSMDWSDSNLLRATALSK